MAVKVCEGCGNEFESNYSAQRFHSRKCWLSKYNTEDRAHTMLGAANGSKAVGDKLRGTGDKTYVKEAGRHQHRVVAERLLGRSLTPLEVVHHEDRDKKNNSPENLIVFSTQAAHVAHHMRNHCGVEVCSCDCIRIKNLA